MSKRVDYRVASNERDRNVDTNLDEVSGGSISGARTHRKLDGTRRTGLEREAKFERNNKDTAALSHLVGGPFRTLGSRILTIKILDRIEEVMLSNPDMVLQGRTPDRLRINYDPEAAGVTSIESRIAFILARSPTSKAPSNLHPNSTVPSAPKHVALTNLIVPLLTTNKQVFNITAEDFAKFGDHELKTETYRSEWDYKQQILLPLRPFTYHKRFKIIDAVLSAAQKHCMQVDPLSPLLGHPDELPAHYSPGTRSRIYAWSLFGPGVGFAARLEKCFKDPERSGEEYEDLIERTLFCFKRANPSAIFGHKTGETRRKGYDGSFRENNYGHKLPNWRSSKQPSTQKLDLLNKFGELHLHDRSFTSSDNADDVDQSKEEDGRLRFDSVVEKEVDEDVEENEVWLIDFSEDN